MRILFVCPATSLHAVRWIRQIDEAGFDLHLFAAEPYSLHGGFRNLTLHNPLFTRRPFDDYDLAKLGLRGPRQARGWWASLWRDRSFDPSVRQRGLWWPFRKGPENVEATLARLAPARMSRAASLARTITRVRPDVVHSLEMLTGGYLALEARRLMNGAFPPWVVSNWGCDLHLFAQLPRHEARMREIVACCDYYSAECMRDVRLAREFGFKGKALAVRPNASVFELDRVLRLRQAGSTSQRRLILGGYQDGTAGHRKLAPRWSPTGWPAIASFLWPLSRSRWRRTPRSGGPEFSSSASCSRRTTTSCGFTAGAHSRRHDDGIPFVAGGQRWPSIQSGLRAASRAITHGRTGMIVPTRTPGLSPRRCGRR